MSVWHRWAPVKGALPSLHDDDDDHNHAHLRGDMSSFW